MGILVSSNRDMHERRLTVYRADGSTKTISRTEYVNSDEEIPFSDDIYLDIEFELHKSHNDEECLVSGWANVALDKDGNAPLDWQDDVIAPETLEKAAVNFMLDYRGSGEMHKGDSKGTVVESIVFTKEKQKAIGIPEGTVPEGWFITVKVHDREVFEKVKNGTYKMFSIQGTAKRTRL